jgi:valyl-tRNA synthetase
MADREPPEAPALERHYDPHAVEPRWVRHWAERPYRADPNSPRAPFTIVIPPPNVTGNLHLGHAFDNVIIDTLIRFKRMRGFEALFQPGTDHAGISTQVQVERALAEDGIDRHALGRDAFLERVWAWKERYGGIILEQLQRLGVSADWSRTRFTMDEGLTRAVRTQFVELFHRGLVYRGERIVQWDPISQTTLSDLEVDREERPGKLYTLAYELEGGDGAGEAVLIATVRPETIFADVAVAVHPDDPRYAALVGRRVRIPLTERCIPVITDEAVEPDFGTGALKITPAHDPTDFEIGEHHGLPRPSVIDRDARLFGELVPEAFRGLDRFEARSLVVDALLGVGSLREVRDHTIALGLSQRTKAPVEPLLSLQWFYDVRPAAQRVLAALDAGEMRLVPERYEKVNRDWLEAIRPWNISRQLWWGHRIPAWYDEDGNVVVPSRDDPLRDPTEDPAYAGRTLTQDPDVFDTWFSSNLWPFSTLGWPDEADPFFRRFYPTDVLVTGYDILFFWVARMQLAAYEFTGRAPFHTVMLHGLVLDAEGQKMSKSRGNGIDPLEVVDASGADALRFALAYASTGAQDVRWDERRVEMGRAFANKLWNAARFALPHLHAQAVGGEPGAAGEAGAARLADRWIRSRTARAARAVTEHLDAFDLGLAARTVYDAVWSEFCDWYLEAAKPALRAHDDVTQATLRQSLGVFVRLLHPLMPFITAELWEALGEDGEVATAPWPELVDVALDEAAEEDFALLQAAVSAVRQLRVEANLAPGQVLDVVVEGPAAVVVAAEAEVFASLARARTLASLPSGASLARSLAGCTVRLPLEGVLDVDAWRERQQRRLADARSALARHEGKLANERFVADAPAPVVAEERRRADEAAGLVASIAASLEALST